MPPRSVNPRSLSGIRILQRSGENELTKQYPQLSGFLESALLGTAPDELGSVMDPLTAERRKGAEYGYPIGIGAQVAPIVGGLGKFAKAVAAAPSVVPGSRAAQKGVIKMKGGNWLSGSVEDALKGLKRPDGDLARRMEAVHGQRIAPIPEADRADALNSWIDKQLTRYVKNEMATPEDPVRALAERGILHVDRNMIDPQTLRDVKGMNEHLREKMGTPKAGMGKSSLAKKWESLSDSGVVPYLVEDLLGGKPNIAEAVLKTNPWMAKVSPKTPVYEFGSTPFEDLGFTHLLDELRNATNPNSGLPRELLLKYEALDKVSVPQAVERVAKINEWRAAQLAAQKAKSDMVRANNAATVLHKDYPDKGFKWVELKDNPEGALPEGWSRHTDRDTGKSFLMNPRGHKTTENPTLADALKYEGDTMGHCVGGYCPDVMEGRKRIYSLRDAEGQPHTTIEVAPGHRAPEGAVSADQLPEDVLADFKARNILDPRHAYVYDEAAGRYLPTLASSPDRIVQIKGKANRAPNPKYLPFVQDFVRSGKWSDVGDLQNTGLYRADPDELGTFLPSAEDLIDLPLRRTDVLQRAKQRGMLDQPFVTRDEWEDVLRQQLQYERGQEPGFAAGGLVAPDDSGYNAARVAELTQQLRAELFPQ